MLGTIFETIPDFKECFVFNQYPKMIFLVLFSDGVLQARSFREKARIENSTMGVCHVLNLFLFQSVRLVTDVFIKHYRFLNDISSNLQNRENPTNYLISKGFSNFKRTSSKGCQMFIGFANQILAILCVKRISIFPEFFILYEVYCG